MSETSNLTLRSMSVVDLQSSLPILETLSKTDDPAVRQQLVNEGKISTEDAKMSKKDAAKLASDTREKIKMYTDLENHVSSRGSLPTISNGGFSTSHVEDPNAVSAKKKQQEIYNDADRSAIMNWQKNAQQGIADTAQGHYSSMDPFWNYNHGRNNWRGNLNGMSFQETLQRSRLADETNNKLHAMPTDIGRRTYHMGATGTGVEGATPRQWDKIETQEMRQMRANEGIDSLARQGDVGLAGKVRGYSYELQSMADKMQSAIAQATGQADINVAQAFQQAVQNVSYTLPANIRFQQILTNFTQTLAYQLKDRALQYCLQKYGTDPAYVQHYFDMFANGSSVGDISNIIYNGLISEILNNDMIPDTEKTRMVSRLMGQVATMTGMATLGGATSMGLPTLFQY